MSLTPTQKTALKTDYLADSALQTLFANSGNGAQAVCDVYNAAPAVAMSVWRTNVKREEIFGAITWSRYTPNDAPDVTITWGNRCMICALKEQILRTYMLLTIIDMGNSGTRKGLVDCVTACPSGNAGAAQHPGGAGGSQVLPLSTRPATRIEKLLAGASATEGATTANVLTFEGKLQPADFDEALAS
jgi:hypothetical protein